MDNLGGLTRVLIKGSPEESGSERSRGWGWKACAAGVEAEGRGHRPKKPGGLRH